ncbi:MAG: hypothetical protein WCO00_16765 [Rhodospirillaceae bacterium]
MKYLAVALLVVGCGFVSGGARADSDDLKWVAQCIKDNADAKVAPEVVASYCKCMNSKMDDNETQSIDKWEKTHAKERIECEKASGWK